eukprot:scaffold277106_cov34-Prasinocladus_malaysianus.AAC.1
MPSCTSRKPSYCVWLFDTDHVNIMASSAGGCGPCKAPDRLFAGSPERDLGSVSHEVVNPEQQSTSTAGPWQKDVCMTQDTVPLAQRFTRLGRQQRQQHVEGTDIFGQPLHFNIIYIAVSVNQR